MGPDLGAGMDVGGRDLKVFGLEVVFDLGIMGDMVQGEGEDRAYEERMAGGI